MKRTLLTAILGVAAVSTTAFGQGSIIFDNYVTGTYNQVVWGAGTGADAGKAATQDTVNLQLWYGSGVVTSVSGLTAGVTATINPLATYDAGAGFGGGGYFTGPTQVLPAWQPGDTYTFAVTLIDPSGKFKIDPILWQETSNIHAVNVAQFGLQNFPGATIVPVPEPSTIALIGLGSAGLLFIRRRRE